MAQLCGKAINCSWLSQALRNNTWWELILNVPKREVWLQGVSDSSPQVERYKIEE